MELDDFKNYLTLERQFSRNTISAYTADVKVFLAYCAENNADFKTVTNDLLDEYIYHLKANKNLSPRSVFRKTEAVKSFYKFLLINNIISVDPCKFLISPKLSQKVPQSLDKEEIRRLLSFPPQNFREMRTLAVLHLFYACGIRVSELTALRLENISIKDKWLLASGKGNKERFVPVHAEALAVLQNYLDERERRFSKVTTASEIFVGRDGKKISRQSVWKDIAALGRLAGISKPLHPHLFRHTFASHLLVGGADLRSVQEMLGHANLDTTQIYTHLNVAEIKEKHKKFHPRS